VTGGCRKLHNEDLHNVNSSPEIIRMIKSRRMPWAGHVARMGRLEMCSKFWLEILKGRDPSEDLGVDGRKIRLEGVGWIDLTPDRDRWRTLVNTVMNLWVS
jgi:hypothetical protein